MEQWKLVAAGGFIAVLGMGAGAWLFGGTPAVAQSSGWHSCFVARQESVDTNGSGRTESVDMGHTILVPAGYVPIGGGGQMGQGNTTATVVFCRH